MEQYKTYFLSYILKYMIKNDIQIKNLIVDDCDFYNDMVYTHPEWFKYYPQNIKDDKTIALIATKYYPDNYEYLSSNLKCDFDIVLYASNSSIDIYENIPVEFDIGYEFNDSFQLSEILYANKFGKKMINNKFYDLYFRYKY
jgi:hypothetical protein